MGGAVFVALVAAIGNLLQGWDIASIAGAILYIKDEFNLENKPTIEGLIVVMSLIGAMLITICYGSIADRLGRRPMLIISSALCFFSGLMMLWSPSIYVLLLARLLDGFGIGLAVTFVPVYISETAPPEIRGSLNTLPKFFGSLGMFISYCISFGFSLINFPTWRLFLGLLSVPSFFYFVLTTYYLPESPRWLVSKGRMVEAKQVLQRLHDKDDVSGELALLVEGLRVGTETSIKDYTIGQSNELAREHEASVEKEEIKLFGPGGIVTLVGRPTARQSSLCYEPHQGIIFNATVQFVDPLVILFGHIHEKFPDAGSKGSMLFPHLGSMFSVADYQPKNEELDEENLAREGDDYASDSTSNESDDNIQSPLISRQATTAEKNLVPPTLHGSIFNIGSFLRGTSREPVSSTGIGAGWLLAWKWEHREDQDGNKGGLKRIYLQVTGVSGSQWGSLLSLPGAEVPADHEVFRASALVSQPPLYPRELIDQYTVGPAMVHPSETENKCASWSDLFEPGVRHALVMGMEIQILQQFSGLNGVLYYMPQILEHAGLKVLLSSMGVSLDSEALLISAITTLLMLPFIAVATRLIDISGRRSLLLSTIPIVIATIIILVVGNVIHMGSVANATVSTISVVLYLCCFVTGFGPIPNIVCAEIFPTQIRGLCMAICAFAFWIGGIIVTYTFPLLLSYIGIAGVFSIFAFFCVVSWAFVFSKVPETKGMPLEVVAELFSVGAK